MIIDPYEFQAVTIADITREAPEAVSVRVTLPANYSYVPGQHAVVRVTLQDGTSYDRQYSYSSDPSSGELWFTIVLSKDGIVSSWFVNEARVGDTVEISRPFTGPLVQKDTRGKLCMIAGGSGIAPLMSQLRQHRLRHTASPVALLYSTHSSSHCFREELIPLSHEYIQVKESDLAGRLTDTEVKSACNGAEMVLICGSHSFVLAMQERCRKFCPNASLHLESFTL